MKKLLPFTLLALALVLGAAAAEAAKLPKITICHFPPGNPANWHTITISENALQKHQDQHGDLIGVACEDASCEQLCSDGDACTQDVMASEDCICLPSPGPPVDCDDDNPCTLNDCDPVDGCLNTPEPMDWPCMENDVAGLCDGNGTCDLCAGVVCDAPDQCQEDGTCNAGVCEYPDAPDGTTCDDGDPTTNNDECNSGTCEGDPDPCLGVTCDDSNSCTEDSCDPTDGSCIFDSSNTDGDMCDDGNPDTTGDQCNSGTCEGDPGVADCTRCTPDSLLLGCGFEVPPLKFQSCYTCAGYYQCGDPFVFPVWVACPGELFDVDTGLCGATSGTCNYTDGVCTGGDPPTG